MRQGFSSMDLKTRDETATATGGMHKKMKHAPTRSPRRNHDHRVMMGKLPMNHGESHGTQKMIANHKGGDRMSHISNKAAAHQVSKHRVSTRSC